MSDEGFLARWSRRKRAAAAREHVEASPQPHQEAAEPITEAADPVIEPAIDVADLPPIESIGPGADVRAFLAPGVPTTVARAALRRAWSADPAIRDFVGLSENSWDFTAADGVPGFGSVSLEDAKRLLDQLAGDPPAEAETRSAAPHSGEPEPTAPTTTSGAEAQPACTPDTGSAASLAAESDIAAQRESGAGESAPSLPRNYAALGPKKT